MLGAFLGVIPGCLGAFAAVSLYSHRNLSFGALVAAMIATSGDEAFVMFSMFPLQVIWIGSITRLSQKREYFFELVLDFSAIHR